MKRRFTEEQIIGILREHYIRRRSKMGIRHVVAQRCAAFHASTNGGFPQSMSALSSQT